MGEGKPLTTPTATPAAHELTHVDGGSDEIDSALDSSAYPMLADVIANRPAAGVAGRFFWSTDEHILYRDTGAAWVKVSVADAADLDGRAGLAQMPDAASGFLEAAGVGSDPVYNALVAGDIPNLDTAKITTGTFARARLPDLMFTGTYTGDGAATQAITGLGFQPDYIIVWVQSDAQSTPGWKSDQDGASSFATGTDTIASEYITDMIISLDADGFTVGDGTDGNINFNASGLTYAYVAFKA